MSSISSLGYVESDNKSYSSSKPIIGKKTKNAEVVANYLHNLMWVLGFFLTMYFTDIINVALYSNVIDRFYFNAGLTSLGTFLSIAFYLAVYLPFIKGLKDVEWNVYCPRMIPTATIAGVITTICFLLAFWPKYGFLTPIILGIMFLGSLMTLSFVPPFPSCDFCRKRLKFLSSSKSDIKNL